MLSSILCRDRASSSKELPPQSQQLTAKKLLGGQGVTLPEMNQLFPPCHCDPSKASLEIASANVLKMPLIIGYHSLHIKQCFKMNMRFCVHVYTSEGFIVLGTVGLACTGKLLQ
jgi:hypothetical protein